MAPKKCFVVFSTIALLLVAGSSVIHATELPKPLLYMNFDDPESALYIGDDYARAIDIDPANIKKGVKGNGLFFHPDSFNYLPEWLAKPGKKCLEEITVNNAAVRMSKQEYVTPPTSLRVEFKSGTSRLTLPPIQFPGKQSGAVFSFYAKSASKEITVTVGMKSAKDMKKTIVITTEWRRYGLALGLDKKAPGNKIGISFSSEKVNPAPFFLDGLQLEPCKNYPQYQTCPTEWMPGQTGRENRFPSIPFWKIPFPERKGTISLWVRLENDTPDLDVGTLTWLTVGDVWRRGWEISSSGAVVGPHRISANLIGYLKDGHFHHLALAWNAKTMVLYLDGKKVMEKKIEEPYIPPIVDREENFFLHLGRHLPRKRTPHGMLDEIAVFSQTLTPEQIVLLARPDTELVETTKPRIVLPEKAELCLGDKPLIMDVGIVGAGELSNIKISRIPETGRKRLNPKTVRITFNPGTLSLGKNEFTVSFATNNKTYDIPVSFLTYPPPLRSRGWKTPPPGVHPRILFTQKDIPGLRLRLKTERGRMLMKHLRTVAPPAQYYSTVNVKKYFDDLEKLNDKGVAEAERKKIQEWISKDGTKGSFSAQGVCLSWMTKPAFMYAVIDNVPAGELARKALLLLIQHGSQIGECLQPAALIYDWCWPLFSENERKIIRKWMAEIATEVIKGPQTEFWGLAPCAYELPGYYWATLAGSKAGLAALAMEGEDEYKSEWLNVAKKCIDLVTRSIVEEDGSFGHGVAYLHFCYNSVCWFWEGMRLRGMRWDANEKMRDIPTWVTYMTKPGSFDGKPEIMNVGRCSDWNSKRSLMWFAHLYPDNPLAARNYRVSCGPAMYDHSLDSPVPWILWDTHPERFVDPAQTLPKTKWFKEWGIFFRSGWQPEDFVFWMGSREHQSIRQGHFDKGSFYLYAYGQVFANDLGAKHSSGAIHNVIDIDGKEPGGAWRSMTCHAPLTSILAGKFVSGAVVDQKEMYDWEFMPHPEKQLKAIYKKPVNPVLKAKRAVMTVWGSHGIPPYFVLADDIDKDGSEHLYTWKMLMPKGAVADCARGAAKVYQLDSKAVSMDALFLYPSGVAPEVKSFAYQRKPYAKLVADVKTINPYFAVMLYPRKAGIPEPMVVRKTGARTHGSELSWPGDVTDLLVFARQESAKTGKNKSLFGVYTDARIALVRLKGVKPVAAAMIDGTVLEYYGKKVFSLPGKAAAVEWVD